MVSTHSRLKAAGGVHQQGAGKIIVSTHSRLKAAGHPVSVNFLRLCFNTQPPKGGWVGGASKLLAAFSFNTQPPKGGW